MNTTTLNVNLTPLLKELVESKVRAGLYLASDPISRAREAERDQGWPTHTETDSSPRPSP